MGSDLHKVRIHWQEEPRGVQRRILFFTSHLRHREQHTLGGGGEWRWNSFGPRGPPLPPQGDMSTEGHRAGSLNLGLSPVCPSGS